jgi:uncharacterized membrane protein YraQ (UPF0718 family)
VVTVIEPFLGGLVVALTLALFADGLAARARGAQRSNRSLLTPVARRSVMTIASVVSAALVVPTILPAARRGLFSFCGVCPVFSGGGEGPSGAESLVRDFLSASWYYAATVIPIFVLASLISGLLIAREERFAVKGVLGSFAFAAVLPLCSCGVVPIAHAIMRRGGRGTRDGVVFLSAAPLLSPIVVLLGFGVLGSAYVGLRLVGSLILAVVAAWVVSPLIEAKTIGGTGGAPHSVAIDPCGLDCLERTAPGGVGRASVLLAGWGVLTRLARFALYGIVLGSAFAAALPPQAVNAVARSGIAGLTASAVVGVPLNMCAGEEILLLGPLVGAGLPMGHALAFSLASTGICVSSIPLLIGVLGRRATVVLASTYLVVPVAIGAVVNLLLARPVP